jgi:putative hemolysin
MQIKSLSKIAAVVFLVFFVVQGQAARLVAANDTSKKSASTKQVSAKSDTASQNQFPPPPKFKDDEYAIFIEDAYQIFKTKKFESLELSESCFNSKKPKCEAYEFAQIKPKDLSIKAPGMNNKSAIHCEAVGGRNLLALDNKNNQYNFCRFADGSMVNSWSMNYKHFPQSAIK